MLRILSRVSLFLLTAVSLIGAQSSSIPGKFYEYYTVATTQGGTFTALGPPSINDNGLCAFTGTTAAGQTIWVSDGHLLQSRNINPGQANLGRVFFDPQLQINTNNQVAAKDYIQGSSQNIRVWDANATDSFVFQARAGLSQPYTALNGAPTINATGDTAFGAIVGTNHELVQVSNGNSTTFGINSSAPQPVMAANRSMVVTTTNRGTGLNQVILFQSGFSSQTIIASGSDFSYLDTAPGISDDGNVVVFQGTLTAAGATNLGLTAGPGIFASVNTGSAWQVIRVTGLMVEVKNSGGNNNGICDPGETCVNAAELGYDDNNNSINFASYPTNSRVAVTNVDFGAPGIADDTFVISFMGTPSHASRTNPVTKNAPLLFSGNTGLWTIRVDVKNQLKAPKALVFHPYTAIPVVQIGDQLFFGNTVTGLSVNLQIANAAEDEFGVERTMRRGDHRVAFLATINGGQQTIFRANHLDSSQDGVLDNWKTNGIDMDQDGVVDIDLRSMGATVGQRDLFLQMDWLSDQPGFNFHPAPGVNNALGGGPGFLPAMLESAPALSGNMFGVRRDGTPPAVIPAGVNMHIDAGNGNDFDGEPFSYNMGTGVIDGGKQIGMPGNNSALVEILYFGVPGSIALPGVNTRAFQDVKDNYFGGQDKDARELAFKYAVLGDHFEFIDNPAVNHPISGAGANFILVGDAYPPGLSANQYIKITSGTGAGQVVGLISLDQTVANQLNVTPFSVVPDTTSTFAYISGSSGNSEVFFYPSPDYNSLPGNDFMMTIGEFAASPNGYLGNACMQWRTLAHEMGHTLGLRHGGVNHNAFNANYESLMSYAWQLECVPVSPVQGYSTAIDPVFDDFSNLNHQFAQVFFHSGNSLGIGYGADLESTQQTPEQTYLDYLNQNGPLDSIKPVVSITSPAANSQVSPGGSLTVTIQATDNSSVATVKASFDANGDGTVGPNEIVTAHSAGGNLYTATFSSVTGSLSPRTLTAIATDPSGNSAKTSISLNVGNSSQFTLTVTEAGTGTGSVSSAPAGISCPSTCSANYNSGTAVTLTASAGTGSTFAGWSGACSGTGSCSVTMSQARAVTATFNSTPVQFALSVAEAGTGTGSVLSSPAGISCPSTCSANYNSGAVVNLTATAATGSTFAGWSGACSGTGSCSVTMSQARAVTATFNTTPVQFALSVAEAGTGAGSVLSSPSGINCPSACSANYNSGTVVNLTATAATGSTFAGWSGACSGTGSCSVTMSQAQSVTATFNTTPVQFALSVAEAGTGTGSVLSSPAGISCPSTCSANYNSGTVVNLTATAATGSTFAGWSGACSGTGSCSVTMSQARAVTATFNTTPVQFALSVAEAGTGAGSVLSSPAGISCPSTCSANYNSGTVVSLTATAASGSTFAGWSGACSGTGSCSVTMSQARAVTATFNTTPVQFALSVAEAGTGTGSVLSSPAGISCPSTCSANYNSGTVVSLTATAATGSTFAGWSGACSGTGSCSVTMSQARAVTATFNTTPVQFALSVAEAGTGAGSVLSSPAGISCPSTCSANYNSGTIVSLTATAATGSTFAGWSGACSGTGSCSVTMSQARAVTATFNTTPVQFALSVAEAGTGTGAVLSSPAGISCPSICSANYNSGTVVSLTATAATGSTFAGWSGACSGTGSCSVTMSQARAVTATFNTTPVQFALSVAEAGTGTGTVISTPTGISCPSTCSANYNSGTVVSLTATPATGSTFTGWSGACSGTGSCSVTMSQARAATATFNTTPVQFALSVAEAGTGTGSVLSSPAGISCPPACSANYNSGTVVNLTATAATGSTFTGWSGACTGTASCQVTMSQARAVTATFTSSGQGSPSISASITARGQYSPGVLFFDMQLKNVGTGTSTSTTINGFAMQTLGGMGTATYNSALSPALPISAGSLASGAVFTVRIYLNVPSTVTQLRLTETGSTTAPNGSSSPFTQSQILNR